jgi:hypothetical protein
MQLLYPYELAGEDTIEFYYQSLKPIIFTGVSMTTLLINVRPKSVNGITLSVPYNVMSSDPKVTDINNVLEECGVDWVDGIVHERMVPNKSDNIIWELLGGSHIGCKCSSST